MPKGTPINLSRRIVFTVKLFNGEIILFFLAFYLRYFNTYPSSIDRIRYYSNDIQTKRSLVRPSNQFNCVAMQIMVVAEPQLSTNPIRKLLTPMFLRHSAASDAEITRSRINQKERDIYRNYRTCRLIRWMIHRAIIWIMKSNLLSTTLALYLGKWNFYT